MLGCNLGYDTTTSTSHRWWCHHPTASTLTAGGGSSEARGLPCSMVSSWCCSRWRRCAAWIFFCCVAYGFLFSEKRQWIGREWLVKIYVYGIYVYILKYVYMYIYINMCTHIFIYIHICIEIWYTQIIMLHNEAAQVQTFSRSFMATRNHREPSFETLGMIAPINVTGRNISTQRTMGICPANLSKSLSSPEGEFRAPHI